MKKFTIIKIKKEIKKMNFRYYYVGSINSAHANYLLNNYETKNLIMHEKKTYGIFKIITKIIIQNRKSIMVSSSPLLCAIGLIFGLKVVFDCHGISKFISIVKVIRPHYALSNSRGTKLLLSLMGVTSKATLPTPIDIELIRKEKKGLRNVVICGSISSGINLEKIDMELESMGIIINKYYHFGRKNITTKSKKYIYKGFKSEQEIQEFIEYECKYGLVFYDENHNQRLFMSPLKCDFYFKNNLDIIYPEFLISLRNNYYCESLIAIERNSKNHSFTNRIGYVKTIYERYL